MYYAQPVYNLVQQPMYIPPQQVYAPAPVMMAPPPPPPVYYAPPPPPPQQVYYPPPPPPPVQNSQSYVVLKKENNNNKSTCHHCNELTPTIQQRKVGFIAVVWCLVLSTCGLCFIPLACTDSCKDTHLVCVKCNSRKNKI